MTETMLGAALYGLLGLIVGSFLNVCISRLPDDYSVVIPRSHCPRCGAWIAWYDNIPVLSFAVLGGRCRACRGTIGFRYPLVELATAACFFAVRWRTGGGWAAAKWALFAALVIELIVSDFETRILPDEFTKGGILAGLFLAPVVPLPQGMLSFFAPLPGAAFASFFNAALTAGLLSGLFYALLYAYERIRGKEGLGFGDVKLVAFIGAFLGLEPSMTAILAGSLAGSLLGFAWIKLSGKDSATFELPFGSFLGAGALLVAWLVM